MNPWPIQHKSRATTKKQPQLRLLYFGGRAGTRTLDPLIKSQLLYQLSYASKTIFLNQRA